MPFIHEPITTKLSPRKKRGEKLEKNTFGEGGCKRGGKDGKKVGGWSDEGGIRKRRDKWIEKVKREEERG